MKKLLSLLGLLVIAALIYQVIDVQAKDDNSPADSNATAVSAKDSSKMTDSTNAEVVSAKGNPYVTLHTSYGDMVLELYRDVAPAHADSFLARTNDGYYDNTIFHRVVKNFMIQGGNAQLVGKKGVDYYLPDETSDLPHVDGTLSMASRGAPTTAQTQFFICLGRNQSTSYLDKKYTNFGLLVKGFDVLHAIGKTPVKKGHMGSEVSTPVEEIKLIDAYHSDAEGNKI